MCVHTSVHCVHINISYDVSFSVLAAAMQHTTIEGTDSPLKPKLPTVSGWAHIVSYNQNFPCCSCMIFGLDTDSKWPF